MKARRYPVHGKQSKTSGCKDRPVCSTCDTGMMCDMVTGDHFCGWYECPDADMVKMAEVRATYNAVMRAAK